MLSLVFLLREKDRGGIIRFRSFWWGWRFTLFLGEFFSRTFVYLLHFFGPAALCAGVGTKNGFFVDSANRGVLALYAARSRSSFCLCITDIARRVCNLNGSLYLA